MSKLKQYIEQQFYKIGRHTFVISSSISETEKQWIIALVHVVVVGR